MCMFFYFFNVPENIFKIKKWETTINKVTSGKSK